MCTGSHPFIPVAAAARLTLLYTLDGVEMVNVFNFRKTGGWSAADITDLATTAGDAWGTRLNGLVTDKMHLVNSTALSLAFEGAETFQYVPSSLIRGTLPDDMEPNTVAFKLKFGTGLSGRSQRGGIYHAGIVKPQTNGRFIDTGVANDIRDAWGLWRDDVEIGVGCELGVVSYCHLGMWRDVGAFKPVISISYTDLLLDTQRRRKK